MAHARERVSSASATTSTSNRCPRRRDRPVRRSTCGHGASQRLRSAPIAWSASRCPARFRHRTASDAAWARTRHRLPPGRHPPDLRRDRRLLRPLRERENYGLVQQNIQSRIRGALLMAISNHEGRLVLATGNKSELGRYCTLYGDTGRHCRDRRRLSTTSTHWPASQTARASAFPSIDRKPVGRTGARPTRRGRPLPLYAVLRRRWRKRSKYWRGRHPSAARRNTRRGGPNHPAPRSQRINAARHRSSCVSRKPSAAAAASRSSTATAGW